MILTGAAIAAAVEAEEITIDPFLPALLNPNSYNYRLGTALKVIDSGELDAAVRQRPTLIEIPADGFVLRPGRVHLGVTVETIGSEVYVPSLIGRSSMGRLGVFLQVSADLGNLGAIHRWTLEMVATQPVRVYAGMRIGQVTFWCPEGAHSRYDGYLGGLSTPAECDPGRLGLLER